MELDADPDRQKQDQSLQESRREDSTQPKVDLIPNSNPSNEQLQSNESTHPSTSTSNSNQTPNYQLLYTVRGHQKSVSSVKFSPDGTMLASSSSDNYLKLWSVRTGQLIKTFVGHDKGINDVVWSSCNEYLASASDDGSVRIWSVRSVSILESSNGFFGKRKRETRLYPV